MNLVNLVLSLNFLCFFVAMASCGSYSGPSFSGRIISVPCNLFQMVVFGLPPFLHLLFLIVMIMIITMTIFEFTALLLWCLFSWLEWCYFSCLDQTDFCSLWMSGAALRWHTQEECVWPISFYQQVYELVKSEDLTLFSVNVACEMDFYTMYVSI